MQVIDEQWWKAPALIINSRILRWPGRKQRTVGIDVNDAQWQKASDSILDSLDPGSAATSLKAVQEEKQNSGIISTKRGRQITVNEEQHSNACSSMTARREPDSKVTLESFLQ
jgi:hypothetical protein